MVKGKRYFKTLIMGLAICCALLISGMKVNAQTVNEVEPNDTMETAQLIQANYETAAQAVSANRPSQYVVKGYTSTADEDWFKVYLTAGTQYATCNDNSFNFQVYDSNNNLIISKSYTKTGFGVKAYPFQVSSAGYYYVKVQGVTSSSSSYILLVGGPTYMVQTCYVSMKSITMSGSNVVVPFDLSLNPNLPTGAVIYTMSMSDVKSTAVAGITVKNRTTGSIVNLAAFSWKKDGLVSLNLPLKSAWDVTFKYNKNTTITPKFSLDYVYPVTSENAQEITISL